MHEYSVVQALLDQCEREAKKAGANRIINIVVKVGKLSGIDPALLKSAFYFFNEDSFCKGAALNLILQKVAVKCKKCGQISELDELYFCCPKCKSEEITIIDGEDLTLMSLEME
ncbi:MAG: hydrogenase/urease nickel incorporation protein HypA [Helicobacteraceae bacterium]|jgi:hydrogenase nickel incorporation protein HypA/HybF|nr:hydrogenase/urease nickel incorporation protein HypA [Helicobacteraceae bacterium]